MVKVLRRAGRSYAEDATDHWSVALSAPTGAGKTVIASAVIETLFDGAGSFPEDPLATVLWVTDDPALNEQTKRKMLQASSTLSPARLITIDAGFDQEVFDNRRVYFLNIQKLARTNPLSRSNAERRTYSLWQTIANTVRDNGAHFYVVIDEAHKGMKSEGDRATIVSRIINGQDGVNPAAPIVWGISATPERFVQAIRRWDHPRTSKAVTVPLDDVRASGLLKDKIVLDNPADSQHEGDTTLARAAVAQTREFESSWRTYAETQGEPAVLPVLVVQVQNTPSDAELTELLAAIFGAWEGLQDENVVNTFGEHTALSLGGHTIRYTLPQEIQDDLDIRVVLCKDAISTGWDCPRAEVLVSLRRAVDYTYIAQLIGRMVRTPLARRIPSDQTLNDVHCYLPRFNKQQVQDIVDRFAQGNNDEPPVEVITDPIRLWRNEEVPEDVFEMLEALPTYVVPGRVYRTQVSRLHTLATLLAGDHIVEDALAQVRVHLTGVLDAQRQLLELDGSFDATIRQIRSLRIERSYALLAADSIEDLPGAASYEMELDDNNVDDLYRIARRKLPEGIAQAYWDLTINRQGDEDYDPTEAKAVVAALALHPAVVDAVEAAAEQLVRTWLRTYQRSIAALPDAKKVLYEPVKREARDSELTDLIAPGPQVVPDLPQRWRRHLLATEGGAYPCRFKEDGWEEQVLNIELRDDDLVGWYRNPTGGPNALRIPWPGPERERAMYPDFILFHRTDSGIRPSIVDPHGFYLSDAARKLRGLAAYADTHAGAFARIDAVAKVDDRLMALDMTSQSVRDAVASLPGDGEVEGLFRDHGGNYN
ncbi:MAG: DEAD/DEAH box helicase family protein [Gordonia polyisoprenivorans]|nr:DEAD/DEAH box helicase family protein [Gordonia polyisoprenivorans]